MIVNINYKGLLAPGQVDKINFQRGGTIPKQKVFRTPDGATLIVFRTGKYRLMGLKKPIQLEDLSLPFDLKTIELQSATLVTSYHCDINLIDLANGLHASDYSFNAETFPALRLTKYNPACVNVFASGKIVVTGFRDLEFVNTFLTSVKSYIRSVLCDYYINLI